MSKQIIKVPSGAAGTQRSLRPQTFRERVGSRVTQLEALRLKGKFNVSQARALRRAKQQQAFAEKLQRIRAKRLRTTGKLQLRQAIAKERGLIRRAKMQRSALRQARFRQLTQPARRAGRFTQRTFKKAKRAKRRVSKSSGGLTLSGGSGGGGLSI